MSESDLSPAMVDLNQANLETLMTLPGISHDLAQQIIEYRETVRPFTEASEILAIQDMSEHIYEGIVDKIVVSLQNHEAIGAPNEQDAEEDSANLTDLLHGQFSDAARIVNNDDEEPQLFDVSIFSDQVKGSEDILTQAETVAAAMANQDDVAISNTQYNEDNVSDLSILETEPSFSDGISAAITRKPAQSIWNSRDFWNPWLLLTVGILGGTILTLLILQAVNGTLVIENHPVVHGLNNHLTTLETQNTALRSELAAMQGTLDTLADQRKQDNDRLQTAELSVQSLLKTSTGLSDQTALLEEDMANLAVNINALNESLTTLDQSVTALDNNKDQVTNLDQAVTNLRNSLAELSDSTLTMMDDITTLKDNTNAVQAEFHTLQDDMVRVNAFLINLRELLQTEE